MIVFNIRHDGRIGLNSLEIREVLFLIAHPNVLDKQLFTYREVSDPFNSIIDFLKLFLEHFLILPYESRNGIDLKSNFHRKTF